MKWFIAVGLLAALIQAQRAPVRKAHDTSHLDSLDRDELLNILDELEKGTPSKSTAATTSRPYLPPSPVSTYAPVTAPTAPPRSKYTTLRPSAPSTRSSIEDLIEKYKNKNKSPDAPGSVDDILRRLRTGGSPASTFNYPGPNYASPGRTSSLPYPTGSSSGSSLPYPTGSSSSSGSLPYPTSYDSRLFPTKPSSSYPSAPSYSSYPSAPSAPSYSVKPSAPSYPSYGSAASSYPTRSSYPSAPSYPKNYPSSSSRYPSSYSPSGTYGGVAPKYAVTSTKKPKGFFSKLFG